jgi:hypothetical protein
MLYFSAFCTCGVAEAVCWRQGGAVRLVALGGARDKYTRRD